MPAINHTAMGKRPSNCRKTICCLASVVISRLIVRQQKRCKEPHHSHDAGEQGALRGDADGPNVGVSILPLPVNERKTELPRESVGEGGINVEAASDPERDSEMDIMGRQS